MKTKNDNIKLYQLNPSQEVSKLQCKYTLFKRVINILTSMSSTEPLDFDLMKQAFNKVVERNDCLRIQFVKKGKELMQYFRPEVKFDNIPVLEFKTQQEQTAFVDKIKTKAIKYMNGVVVEPYFIKTFDGKYMVFLKVCHMILDIYGITMIFKDLFQVYDALKNNKPLPKLPTQFEDVVAQDLIKKNDPAFDEKNRKFFTELLQSKEQPYYAGIHGSDEPYWQKQRAKGSHAQKMFFIKNDTQGYMHSIDKSLVDKAIAYCTEQKQSIANFLFYVTSVCASKLNGGTKHMSPLELCNCRGSIASKNCAGTKVQSICCYTTVDADQTFEQNFTNFCNDQNILYRHIGFADQEFEMLRHKIYKASLLETFYSITYSFIPYQLEQGLEFQVYSNGKCALPAYIAQMYNTERGNIDMVYDVQTKIITEQDVANFHANYVHILSQILDNPTILTKDITLLSK